MDSRLQRRIKWWKEQLKKKKKHKREGLDTVPKEKVADESKEFEEDEETTSETTSAKRQGRKRKRKQDTSELISEDASFSGMKRKREDKSFDDTEAVEEAVDSTSDSVKKKYILFIGNLPFSATMEDIVTHFQRAGIKVVNFRLLTKKSGSSKGCGFMELKSSKQLQAGLKLHHTKFDDRRINVELSCGGGGKNDTRKEKIKAKNRRLQQQRIKKRKKASTTKLTDKTEKS